MSGTTPAATAAQTRYLSSPAAATSHGKTHGFVLRLPPQNIAHATFCSHYNAICNHSFRKRIELRTQLQELHHHFPSSPPPFVTTPLHHHFPSSPLPFLNTSHRNHIPSSPLPFSTTSLRHHSPSSPLPFVTTSLRHHFPIVTTSLRHHPVS